MRRVSRAGTPSPGRGRERLASAPRRTSSAPPTAASAVVRARGRVPWWCRPASHPRRPAAATVAATTAATRTSSRPRPSLTAAKDGGHGALRSHFLRQGIIPSPRVDSSRLPPDELRRIRDPSSPPPCVPPPDPRGVSSANPEDVIDMATLYDPSVHLPDKPDFSSASNRERYEGGTPLTDELVAYIGVRGPITTAEFMRRALRHEDHGYYTGKGARAGGAPARSAEAGAGAAGEVDDDGFEEDDNDWDLDDDSDDYAGIRSDGSSRAAGGTGVIGRSGDFITAPEISQLFGESLLVWFMTQYAAMGRPSRAQLIEIGPGRGTLVCDMVRSAVERFPDLSEALANGAGGQRMALEDLAGESIMVEKGYSFDFPGDEGAGKSESPDGDDASDEPSPSPSAAEAKRSISVTWHDAHGSVPSKDADGAPVPTFVVCQELVDALPVHSFQKTEEGVWRERLVDVAVRDEEEAEAEAARVGGGVAAAARARGRYASAEGADKVRSSFSSAAESAPRTGGTAAAAGAKKGDKLPRLRFVLPPDTTPAVRTLLRVDATGRPLPDNPAAHVT
ncbi:hypothetical protein THAOC_17149 [Thalassiosira oceanica]|uniref:Protein arginine methyltransferase NDUFAF7 n=1 Tax=Thalassiosira oceanica TaxID=159749 RepID=K0SMU9_THAOC|nr:hypothetical protein THAOC_17149 [Thalassiosira oceanica]|eukprot:EJK62246.1 hypothetical protein THAOC_17149 [Thalassiosira oceanica]